MKYIRSLYLNLFIKTLKRLVRFNVHKMLIFIDEAYNHVSNENYLMKNVQKVVSSFLNRNTQNNKHDFPIRNTVFLLATLQ